MRATFAALGAREFDVLVIGGGITGAGVARDAAMRGLTVALVEKTDWAAGTSGRSSRLVHGGIRYLEQAQIGLVRESVRERETLLRIAPHLVRPLEFTWPVYHGARLPKWKLNAGLTVYDLLAGRRRGHRHDSLSADEVLAHEPALRRDGLVGGASYFDAITDDEGLTRATVAAATESGALAVNRARAERFTVTDGMADGCIVSDMISGEELRVAARCIVSATGPWQAKGTKGSHIVLRAEQVANRSAVTMISPDDGRVMFVLPWALQTIVGTTDLRTDESPDDVTASEQEIAYLLRAVNAYFPAASISRDDVIATWSGIRPLAMTPPGARPSSISREHRISKDANGVLVVTGGKLTTYRAMAAEVVDRVERELRRPVRRSPTDEVPLPEPARDDSPEPLASLFPRG